MDSKQKYTESLSKVEFDEMQRLLDLKSSRPNEITDSERARLLELMKKEWKDQDLSEKKKRKSKKIRVGNNSDNGNEKGIDEAIEGELRQIIVSLTHSLHTGLSDSNPRWFDTVKHIQNSAEKFSSLSFFSHVLQRALSIILTERPDLVDPKELLAYLKSVDGKKELAGKISSILKNPPADLISGMKI